MKLVKILREVTFIDNYAFYNSPVTIHGYEESYAQTFAASRGLPFVALPMITSISLDKQYSELYVGDTVMLFATIEPPDTDYSLPVWSSSDESVASVINGQVIGVGGGTALITASARDGSGVKAECNLSVLSRAVESITLDKRTLSLSIGQTDQLIATIEPGNASDQRLAWKSSELTVALVTTNGQVIAIGGGSTIITATALDGSGSSADCEIMVRQEVTGITFDRSSLTLDSGTTQQLNATVSPSNASDQTLSWTSSNQAAATVDENGSVSAVARGTTTITATAKDGSGKSAACEVTVLQKVTGITLDAATHTLDAGKTQQLTATVLPVNASDGSLFWASSDESIATVDATGLVTAVARGSATITATANDGSGIKAKCDLTILKDVSTCVFDAILSQTYTGTKIEPEITVRDDDYMLVPNEDYTLDYSQNVNVGTATISVTCTGYYYGNQTLYFDITKAAYDMSGADWDYVDAFVYDGSKKSVYVTGLPAGVTAISYNNNEKTIPGTYIAAITLAYDAQNYLEPVVMPLEWEIINPNALPVIILGDADDNGKINIMDLVEIIDFIVNKNPVASAINADADENGKINIMDLVEIIDFIVNKNPIGG